MNFINIKMKIVLLIMMMAMITCANCSKNRSYGSGTKITCRQSASKCQEYGETICSFRTRQCPSGRICCKREGDVSRTTRKRVAKTKRLCKKNSKKCQKIDGVCSSSADCNGQVVTSLCSGFSCSCCLKYTCSCGRDNKNTKKRRLPFKKQKSSRYSWLVGITVPTTKEIHCSGVIINNWFVLTAAHCVFNSKTSRLFPTKKIKVVLTSDDDSSSTSMTRVKVKSIILHRDFCIFDAIHDLALVRLKKPINFGKDGILPICLPQENDTSLYSSQGVAISVTGGTKKNRIVTKKVSVTIEDGSCRSMKKKCLEVGDGLTCAQATDSSTCLETSGVPLTVEDNGRIFLAGVASFGEGCNSPDTPTVFTRIVDHMSWISQKTSGAVYCS